MFESGIRSFGNARSASFKCRLCRLPHPYLLSSISYLLSFFKMPLDNAGVCAYNNAISKTDDEDE